MKNRLVFLVIVPTVVYTVSLELLTQIILRFSLLRMLYGFFGLRFEVLVVTWVTPVIASFCLSTFVAAYVASRYDPEITDSQIDQYACANSVLCLCTTFTLIVFHNLNSIAYRFP